MYFPQLNVIPQSRVYTEVFRGYNHNLKIYDGEWYDETNMCSSYYPLFAQRDKRGTVAQLVNPQGLLAKEALMYVDGATLYYNGAAVAGVTLSTASDMIPKRLVSMGAYAVIFPDKVYVNTADLTDYGNIDATFTTISGADVSYQMCKADGTAYTGATISVTAPAAPLNGALWVDAGADVHTLKQYSTASALWVSIPTTYTRIGYTNIGANFEEWDGVTLSGCTGSAENTAVQAQIAALNTTHVIYAKGADYIVVVGLLDQAYTQQTGSVTVKRECPAMDYVIESNNRLWGCKYGMVGGESVNELYACKLGDFKNWNCFMGISTDSYAVTVGSDGLFTGAFTHLGYPLFFKENCIHKVAGSQPSNFSVDTTVCRGVQQGSHSSLAIVNELLFYKSRSDVCYYDGALPNSVSDALGVATYSSAVAGVYGSRYYISMKDAANAWHLFCYDVARGIWHREDATQAAAFAQLRGDLVYVDAATKKLMSATGATGTLETSVSWSAESGIMGYEYPDAKYISRFNIRAKLAAGATITLYVEYDSSGTWVNMGTYTGTSYTQTFTIPVIPRRCDHLRLKLAGAGDAKLYSMARILEQGGDG